MATAQQTPPLHFEIHGAAGRPLLVLLHGFMGNRSDWSGLIAALCGEFSLLVFDLPGHGKSADWERDRTWNFPMVGRAVAATVQKFSAGQRKFLLGYSMGGRLALYVGIRYPRLLDGMLLESASPGLASKEERRARIRQDEHLAQQLETGDFQRFLREWYALPLFRTLRAHPDFPEMLARRANNDPRALAKALREMSTGRQPALWQELEAINFPLRLVIGEKDAKFGAIAAEMQRRNPRISRAVIPGCGHNLHLEAPGAFADCVREFLRTSIRCDRNR